MKFAPDYRIITGIVMLILPTVPLPADADAPTTEAAGKFIADHEKHLPGCRQDSSQSAPYLLALVPSDAALREGDV